MSNPAPYAERMVLLVMLLAVAVLLFSFGGLIFVGILQSVSH